ncbi:MAG TPA: N-acetyl-gamma-glutamyl-phosphate reductase [Gammaproteobacteria bacterium]|nr:N-acetyl-gamma-glutamyl-phosphate reductase [Gammaproteobacteria bacterium]
MTDKTIKAGIVGATGYTGGELIRLLLMHPHVDIAVVTSRSEAGRHVTELFPNLRQRLNLAFTAPDTTQLAACDVIFFATPNGTAMTMAPHLLQEGARVVDLSADFRIKDSGVWSHWYGMTHACPELLAEAVYGLPEMNRQAIAAARLVANPGCYPTAVQLGFLPLVEEGLVDTASLIANTASGVSGAGRKAATGLLFSELDENFKAYNVAGHRHQPEIVQGLQTATQHPVRLTFVPHLVPMVRGIHATLYGRLQAPDTDLQALYEQRFAEEPFVDVLPAGQHAETRTVTGGNHCRMAVFRPGDGDTVVVLSVIDNLIKGAAGQAVQNMNIMFGYRETAGLESIAMMP